MNVKRFALKGLVILGVVVALCMFFARTIQTITTPKVRLSEPVNGKLEQRIDVKSKVHFPANEPIAFLEAMKNNVVVNRVYIKPGYPVEKGELLFTATMPDYEDNMKKLRADWAAKTTERTKLDIDNRSRKAKSIRNDRYNAMLEAERTLSDLRVSALVLALQADFQLPGNMEAWADAQGMDEPLGEAVHKTAAAYADYQAARTHFYRSYRESKASVSSETFEYVLKREKLTQEIDELEAQMVKLERVNKMLSEVRAPRDGYIASVGVKEGEVYDGKKFAYAMDHPGQPPVLRADISRVTRSIADGARAIVKFEYDEQNTSVIDMGVDEQGLRYLDMELTEKMLSYRGGLYAMISQGEVDATITYRASEVRTLIPASALRSGDGGDFVFVAERKSGGFMGSKWVVRKMNITVIEKSDKLVSVSETLTGLKLADREDREIADGQQVMEYLD